MVLVGADIMSSEVVVRDEECLCNELSDELRLCIGHGALAKGYLNAVIWVNWIYYMCVVRKVE